ncbi:MAG: D-alanyl-D-alanine carboxypeptidase family protein [Microbacteriaceae bacterium]
MPELTRREQTAAQRAMYRRRRIAVFGGAAALITIIVVAVAWFATRDEPGGVGPSPSASPVPSPSPAASEQPEPTPSAEPTPEPEPTFDMTAHSIDDADSIWVVANKLRPLDPIDFEPDDLVYPGVVYVNEQPMRQQTADALVVMFDAAAADGIELTVQSAYRSYERQVSVYQGWVNSDGQEAADLTSARPGHSEHQTGLAVDVSGISGECALDQCFGDTAYGEWLAENSWEYGFIVRYPDGLTDVTGYEYEPWHMRFVGAELATEMHTTGVATLEQFFGLPDAPTYE